MEIESKCVRVRESNEFIDFINNIKKKKQVVLDRFSEEWDIFKYFNEMVTNEGKENTLHRMKRILSDSTEVWSTNVLKDYVLGITFENTNIYKNLLEAFTRSMTEVRRVPEFSQLDNEHKEECFRQLKSVFEEKLSMLLKRMILDLIYDIENDDMDDLSEEEEDEDENNDNPESTTMIEDSDSDYVPDEESSSSSEDSVSLVTSESSEGEEEPESDIAEDDGHEIEISDDDDTTTDEDI